VRQIITVHGYVPETQESLMKRFSLTRVASLLAIVGVLTLTSASAKEPAKDTTPNKKGTTVRATEPSGHAAVHSRIPNNLETLKLSQEQRDQILAIVGKCDGDHATVWNQFSERYMETITVECTLLAAIEDGLTETQRKQVRGHRHQTAHRGKSPEAANGQANNQTTNRANDQAIATPGSVVKEEITLLGVTLTPEQEAAADTLQGKYLDRLRSLNREIEGLHTRLVALEADKLVEIAKVLTKEQLTQLHEIRQSAPAAVKVASIRTTRQPSSN
jgi:hypothetical protein